MKESFIKELKTALLAAIKDNSQTPRHDLVPFGSFGNGTSFAGSDIDLLYVSHQTTTSQRSIMYTMACILENKGCNVQNVPFARVPITKFSSNM